MITVLQTETFALWFSSLKDRYRLYFIRQENTVILLLCGGDKSSQNRDILRAKDLAKKLE